MCELLIAAGGDAPGNPRRGDVVAILPDGHAYGLDEARDPRFRILRAPAAKAADFADLLSPEFPSSPTAEHARAAHYRAFFLDLDGALPEGLRDYLGDASREAPAYDVAASLLRGMVARRASVQPPAGLE